MADGEVLDQDRDPKRVRGPAGRGENRLPPALAVVAAAVVYALLPESLLFAPRLAIPIVEAALLVALLVTNPRRRVVPRTRWSRLASVALASITILTNFVALGLLVAALADPKTKGLSLLLGAMQVWFTNVIGFSLLYWELDRGGPVARHQLARSDLPPADWRFSQDENGDAVDEVAASSSEQSGWIPGYIDYLYLSVTNSSAFSPTDTMPLSTRAKSLMAAQATAALLITLLVIARAIGSFGGGGGGG